MCGFSPTAPCVERRGVASLWCPHKRLMCVGSAHCLSVSPHTHTHTHTDTDTVVLCASCGVQTTGLTGLRRVAEPRKVRTLPPSGPSLSLWNLGTSLFLLNGTSNGGWRCCMVGGTGWCGRSARWVWMDA
jgi:hypothetical protein